MQKSRLNRLPREVILWGGTGQAKVARPIIEHYGARVVAVFDDTPGLASPFKDVPIYRGMAKLREWYRKRKKRQVGFCVAVGNPHGDFRLKLHDILLNEGLIPVSFAHPSAVISGNAEIGDGAQILAGAIVGAEAKVGKQCILNTRASVDHEDVLEDGVEIAPGATLCGLVHIKRCAWVCAGATVLPRVTIGRNAIVGAGAVVVGDVPNGLTVVGVPAKPLKSKGSKK